MQEKKTILVAPLNWGLGHTTRCVPIIHALKEEGFQVLLGSDGVALDLLKKEFPEEDAIELPSYQIEYAKKGKNFKWKMLLRSPKVIKAINAERKLVKRLVKENKIDGVISDNRLGLYSDKIPTVFITHQLQVLSGKTTKITSALHSRYIKRFNECWVPDYADSPNLSGKLGHPKDFEIPVKYIGLLSRLHKSEEEKIYDIAVLLSGPEPQRTDLEEILLHELKRYNGQVLFIRGVVEEEQTVQRNNNIKLVNYMESSELEKALNCSDLILSRSGYTTIMDLAKLGKKAFFIPTPGQTEQEYLAKRLKKKGMVPCANQEEFKLKDLSKAKVYKGFDSLLSNSSVVDVNFRELFGLFEGKRKLRANSKITFYINLFIMRFNDVLNDREAKS